MRNINSPNAILKAAPFNNNSSKIYHITDYGLGYLVARVDTETKWITVIGQDLTLLQVKELYLLCYMLFTL
jgi:hypothetical protein